MRKPLGQPVVWVSHDTVKTFLWTTAPQETPIGWVMEVPALVVEFLGCRYRMVSVQDEGEGMEAFNLDTGETEWLRFEL